MSYSLTKRRIISGSEWEQWIQKYHICLYPRISHYFSEFAASSGRSNWAREEVRIVTFELKVLLLVFDFAQLHGWDLFLPWGRPGEDFAYSLKEDREFRYLLSSGLIVTDVAELEDFESALCRTRSIRRSAGWADTIIRWGHQKGASPFALHYQYNRATLVDYWNNLRENIYKFVDRNLYSVPDEHKDFAISTFEEACSHPEISFCHDNIFVRMLERVDSYELKRFFRSAILQGFRVGDKIPNLLVVPYLGQAINDSVIRYSNIERSYCFLYSPGFLADTISSLIGTIKSYHLGMLTVEDLKYLRDRDSWRPALDEIHQCMTRASSVIDNIPAEHLREAALEQAQRILYGNSNWACSITDVVISLAMSALKIVPGLHSSEISRRIQQAATRKSNLFLRNRHLMNFLSGIESRVRLRLNTKQ